MPSHDAVLSGLHGSPCPCYRLERFFPLQDKRLELGCRNRLGEEISLYDIAAKGFQGTELFFGFHAFGDDRNGEEIQPGESVKVGDKITVKYRIWNAENRSFVKITAGREASLSPVQQLSGLVSYNAYRNVKADATEYYYESYPEEKTTVIEEFFVVRAGTFQAPVTVIESLYAPHYRANSAYHVPLKVIPH